MPRPSVIDSVRTRIASSVFSDLSREKKTESRSYSCEYVSKRKKRGVRESAVCLASGETDRKCRSGEETLRLSLSQIGLRWYIRDRRQREREREKRKSQKLVVEKRKYEKGDKRKSNQSEPIHWCEERRVRMELFVRKFRKKKLSQIRRSQSQPHGDSLPSRSPSHVPRWTPMRGG